LSIHERKLLINNQRKAISKTSRNESCGASSLMKMLQLKQFNDFGESYLAAESGCPSQWLFEALLASGENEALPARRHQRGGGAAARKQRRKREDRETSNSLYTERKYKYKPGYS